MRYFFFLDEHVVLGDKCVFSVCKSKMTYPKLQFSNTCFCSIYCYITQSKLATASLIAY